MFNAAMFCDLLNQFCQQAYQNSKDKGFWDEQEVKLESDKVDGVCKSFKQRPINFGEKYMLMVSELCELFEAHRKGKLNAPCDKEATIIDPKATVPVRIRCVVCDGLGAVEVKDDPNAFAATCTRCAGQGLINTTGIRRLTNEEEELADLAIRLADYCGYRGINLGAAIISKMQYNSTRPYMHGKTC